MRDNGRPALLASKMPPNLLDLRPGWRPLVACPDCGIWRTLKRGMILPHSGPEHADARRCPGSAQRVIVDVSVAEWQARLAEAVAHTALRRGSRTVRTPKPPMPTPMHRIAAAR